MDCGSGQPSSSHVYELPRPEVRAVLEVPDGTARGIGVGLMDSAMGVRK